jgi:precorrin-3B synthase
MRGALRKGWCPSALRPMASGDGLIVRLGQRASCLSSVTARALADLARRCGNGLLDLSGRGHLQFRGVTEASLPLLQAELDQLGLLEPEDGPAAARTIMTSPLAGIDPAALVDSRPLAASLRARLLGTPAMYELSPKFFFAIDEGGLLSVAGEQADVSFVPARCDDGAVRFAISLGGARAGSCEAAALPDVATRLAQAFLDLRGGGADAARRMAELVHRVGASEICRKASVAAALAADIPSPNSPQPIGRFQLGEHHVSGIGLPFGRLSGKTLRLLADVADKSQGHFRLTPWRAILIVSDDELESDALQNAGLILDADDPLRVVAACPGAPGCANGTTATQADARRLAPLARQIEAHGIALHVSGCEKGCAHAGPAPITLVGCRGAYDVVIKGRADAVPVVRDLRPDDMEKALRALIAAKVLPSI